MVALKRISYDMAQGFIGTENHPEEENEPVKSPYSDLVLRELMDGNLTKKQKYYIMLYYKDGLTMEEIARKCGVNRSTVSRTIFRGRERMLAAAKKQAFRRLLGQK